MTGGVLAGLVVPHAPPPPEWGGKGEPHPVLDALRAEGRRLLDAGVETVVALTTHWQPDDAFYLDDAARHATVTDYAGFSVEVEYDCDGDPSLATSMVNAGVKAGVPAKIAAHGADHAITIPLSFMFPEKGVKVIPASVSRLPLEWCQQWGAAVARAAAAAGRRIAITASGALSHDLAAFIARRRTPDQDAFDQAVIDLLVRGHPRAVLNLKPHLLEAGKPEGGFRDLLVLVGAMAAARTGERPCARLAAYESLPGVGQAVLVYEGIAP